jgi:acyl-CoA reductase-like NAD-dependent aldehyde dehydrogenase
MAFYTPETFDVDELLRKAKIAQAEFAKLDQEAVDKIFLKVAHEADKNRVPLAIQAVEETRMGLVEDKVLKNGLAAEVSNSDQWMWKKVFCLALLILHCPLSPNS